ncbi:hypothetical protein K0M31_011191 [Melipona bicolor]|uniref:Uncharacterized protein n=1 Tax=Melipona bicolor TaxID=60889 RepID=A0AA40G9S6_9HYME|nr:hypothetical protein K0M31_011191 [Melipona bicolor]
MHVTRFSCMCTHGKQAHTHTHTHIHKERRVYTNGYHLPILFVSFQKKKREKKKTSLFYVRQIKALPSSFFSSSFFFAQLCHSRTPSRTIITVSPFPENNEENEKL